MNKYKQYAPRVGTAWVDFGRWTKQVKDKFSRKKAYYSFVVQNTLMLHLLPLPLRRGLMKVFEITTNFGETASKGLYALAFILCLVNYLCMLLEVSPVVKDFFAFASAMVLFTTRQSLDILNPTPNQLNFESSYLPPADYVPMNLKVVGASEHQFKLTWSGSAMNSKQHPQSYVVLAREQGSKAGFSQVGWCTAKSWRKLNSECILPAIVVCWVSAVFYSVFVSLGVVVLCGFIYQFCGPINVKRQAQTTACHGIFQADTTYELKVQCTSFLGRTTVSAGLNASTTSLPDPRRALVIYEHEQEGKKLYRSACVSWKGANHDDILKTLRTALVELPRTKNSKLEVDPDCILSAITSNGKHQLLGPSLIEQIDAKAGKGHVSWSRADIWVLTQAGKHHSISIPRGISYPYAHMYSKKKWVTHLMVAFFLLCTVGAHINVLQSDQAVEHVVAKSVCTIAWAALGGNVVLYAMQKYGSFFKAKATRAHTWLHKQVYVVCKPAVSLLGITLRDRFQESNLHYFVGLGGSGVAITLGASLCTHSIVWMAAYAFKLGLQVPAEE